jgi:hypothetical protein
MTHTVIDRRRLSEDYVEPPSEVCRICGSTTVHTREYNKPTMDCINYLRSKIKDK